MIEDLKPGIFGNLDYAKFPKMATVKQNFECPEISDLESAITEQFSRQEIDERIQKGSKIAVLVGSRGIAGINRIVLSVITELKKRGALPFIVPAMASHGGATEQGQRDLLASYGISEQTMGVEIRSTMMPEKIGVTNSGVNVWFDVNALHADGVIPINRIKAHTAFRGPHESGLIKILTIGAGKQKGAESLHSHGADTFATLLPEAFEIVRRHAHILFGLGIVENAREKTARIEAIPAEAIAAREEQLLKLANSLMPKILFRQFDVLVVCQTGKNISGDGMDPNITGRYAVPNLSGGPDYQRLALLDVTAESHGNAIGVGMADVTTQKLISKMKLEFMYINAFTSKMVLPLAKLPIIAAEDREAIGVALRTCVRVKKGMERVVLIKNTLELAKIAVSEPLLAEARNDSAVEVLSEPQEMQFDAGGNLLWEQSL